MNLSNRRADAMWEFILPYLASMAPSSTDKNPLAWVSIIDLGSGYGDFMDLALAGGCRLVNGVDRDRSNIRVAIERLAKKGYMPYRYGILEADLNSKREQVLVFQQRYSAAFCFSLLPYLDFPDDLLFMMSTWCDVAFIECQYDGDGPGLSFIKHDDHMKRWLKRYWVSVNKIGETHLDIRPASRSIWKCYVKKNVSWYKEK